MVRPALDEACRRHGVLILYLFGSRADDGRRLLSDERIEAQGSDLDVGVVFERPPGTADQLAGLQVALEDVFAPLRVDLVPLDQVDSLFQFRAIDGHRVFTSDGHRADVFELTVMRQAADLLPIQRGIERDRFGVSSS